MTNYFSLHSEVWATTVDKITIQIVQIDWFKGELHP